MPPFSRPIPVAMAMNILRLPKYHRSPITALLAAAVAVVVTVLAASVKPSDMARIAEQGRAQGDAFVVAQATSIGAPALGQAITQSSLDGTMVRKLDWFFDAAGLYSSSGVGVASRASHDVNYARVEGALDYDPNASKGGLLAPYREMMFNIAWALIPLLMMLSFASTALTGWLGGGGGDMNSTLVTTVIRLFLAIILLVSHVSFHIGVQGAAQALIEQLSIVNADAGVRAIQRVRVANPQGELAKSTRGMSGSPQAVAQQMSPQLGLSGAANQLSCIFKSTSKAVTSPDEAESILGLGEAGVSECDVELTRDASGTSHPNSSFMNGSKSVWKWLLTPSQAASEAVGEALMTVVTHGIMAILFALVGLTISVTIWALIIAVVIAKNLSLVFAPLAMAFYVWPQMAGRTSAWFQSHLKILFLLPFYTLLLGMLTVAMPVLYDTLSDLGLVSVFIMFVGFIFVCFKGKDLADSYGTEVYGIVNHVAASLSGAMTVAASAVVTAGVGLGAGMATGAMAGGGAGLKTGMAGIRNAQGLGQTMSAGLSAFGSGIAGATRGGIAGLGKFQASDFFRYQGLSRGLMSGDADAAFNATMKVSEIMDKRHEAQEEARKNRRPASAGASGSPVIAGVTGIGGLAGTPGDGSAVGGVPVAGGQVVAAPAAPSGPAPIPQATDHDLATTEMWKPDGSGRFFNATTGEGVDPYAVIANKAKDMGLGDHIHEIPAMLDPATGQVTPKRLAVAPEAESAFAAALDPSSTTFDAELAAAVQVVAHLDDIGKEIDITKAHPSLVTSMNTIGAVLPTFAGWAGGAMRRAGGEKFDPRAPRSVSLSELASHSQGGANALRAARDAGVGEATELARRDNVVRGLGLADGTASAVIARHLHPTITTPHQGDWGEVTARLDGRNGGADVIGAQAVGQAMQSYAAENPSNAWNQMTDVEREVVIQRLMTDPSEMAQHPGLDVHLAMVARQHDDMASQIANEVVVVERNGAPTQYGLDIEKAMQSSGAVKEYLYDSTSRMAQKVAQLPNLTQEEVATILRSELQSQLKQKVGEGATAYNNRINRAMFVS